MYCIAKSEHAVYADKSRAFKRSERASSSIILRSCLSLSKVQHWVAATFFQWVPTISVDGGLNAVDILELRPIYDHLKNMVELDSFSHSIRPFTLDAATPICLEWGRNNLFLLQGPWKQSTRQLCMVSCASSCFFFSCLCEYATRMPLQQLWLRISCLEFHSLKQLWSTCQGATTCCLLFDCKLYSGSGGENWTVACCLRCSLSVLMLHIRPFNLTRLSIESRKKKISDASYIEGTQCGT